MSGLIDGPSENCFHIFAVSSKKSCPFYFRSRQAPAVQNWISLSDLVYDLETPTKFLPKRSYQNVPKNKVPAKRVLAIKFLYPKVPKHKRLPGTNGSQVQIVPRYTYL
jgi:hypothetical protein